MLIRYDTDRPQDGPLLARPGLYGGSPLKIVLLMREFSSVGEGITLDEYLRMNVARLQHAGITMTVSGDTLEAQAVAFLEALLAHRIVRPLPDGAGCPNECRPMKGGR
jgi:1,6-anhydro-N-acetylmuramate kinase